MSTADEIAKLAALKDAGHLTQAEFDAKKAELLGTSHSPAAAAQQQQLHTQVVEPKKEGHPLLITLGIGLAVLFVIGLVESNNSTKPTATVSPSVPGTSVAAAIPTIGDQWFYSSPNDDMTGNPIRTAYTSSTNTMSLDFPYQGEQHATLRIRSHPRYGHDIIVDIEQGQILCQSYEDCTIAVRFDNGPLQHFSAVGPSDNSSDSVFIRSYDRFVGLMKKAKRVTVELPIFQAGNHAMIFDVSGFNAAHYAGNDEPNGNSAK